MYLHRIKFFISLLIISSSFVGCYLIGDRSPELMRPAGTNFTEGDSTLLQDIEAEYAYVELETLEDSESKWSGLTNDEKLDSTETLLEIVESRQTLGDFTSSSFYLHNALEIIYDIDVQDTLLNIDRYKELKAKTEFRYKSFLTGVDILPEESSTDDIFAGISLSESDSLNGDSTAYGSPELMLESSENDSLNVESGIFEKPELTIESSELDSLMSIQIVFPDIPIEMNKKVENVIKFFQGKGRKVFTKWLERSEFAVPRLTKILREQGLPEDLVYLSMIESGFNPKAYSYAHAAGPWQFISSTARIFDLKVDWWYDERRDVDKSTIAATKYLKKLYLDFDDWYLALASYNCGEGRVRRHIRKYGTRNFWELKKLPRQTRNYVPTFLAAMIIAKNPTEYGFEEPVFKNSPPIDSVLVTECIDLNAIAEIVDTTYQYIKELNPEIVRWCTPPTQDSVWLNIPLGKVEDFYAGVGSIPESQKRSWVRHRVRSGETLSTIARKYGTSMQAIADIKANNIRSKHQISAGKYLLVPVPPYKYTDKMAKTFPSEPIDEYIPDGKKKIIYVVRPGDTVSEIAEKFNVGLSKVKQANNLWRKRYIYPGQKLTIYVAENYGVEQTFSPNVKVTVSGKVHVVREGESLWSISQIYNLDLNLLKTLNGFTSKSTIHPGDEIKLYESESAGIETKVSDQQTTASAETDTVWSVPEPSLEEEAYHVVLEGESLWLIARRYKLDVDKLKEHNRLTGAIQPGDKIMLYGITVAEIGNYPSLAKDSKTVPDVSIQSNDSDTINDSNPGFHIVKSGENLWLIARKYELDVDKLKRFNGLFGSEPKIKVGDKIKLYTDADTIPEQQNVVYTVKRGDTLWAIASAHGIGINDLTRYNDLSSNSVIKPGDKLIIPLDN